MPAALRAARRLPPATLLLAAALGCGGPTASGGTPVEPTPVEPTYVPGQSYFGREGYIEYVAGNAPVILTAPHGGTLQPAEIPDRTAAACGGSVTVVTDANTADLVRTMQRRFHARWGTYPHVIINRLSRRKLDANRTATEAACGDAEALAALAEWHAYVDAAKAAVLRASGRGWYMDVHGHGHAVQRLELGYLLTAEQLALPDAALDASTAYEQQASIRTLSQHSPLPFSALLRGPGSLGALYAANGFPAVPSSQDPSPGEALYFNGGDNTRRHACGAEATPMGGATGGGICGVQVEANYAGVRDTPASRERFADVTAVVLEEYLRVHWGVAVR